MSRGLSARWIAALVGLFLVAGVAVVPRLDRWHVDEGYYTDAALRMRQDGDFLALRTADGAPRYQKPILPYWAVAAGFELAGVGPTGARLVFLVAGALTILAAAGLAWRLFGRPEAALAAAAITASHHDIWSASVRATPDILLTLFVSLSLTGFAGLLFRPPGPERKGHPIDPWLAWVGAGLAVASKGLVGLLVPAWCVAFGRWNSGRNGGPRLPWPVLPIVTGVALAGGWFGLAWATHGLDTLQQFYGDQLGTRTGASPARMADNAARYVVALLRDYLPWIFALAVTVWRRPPALRAFLATHRNAFLFAIGWYLVLFVMFSAGNVTRTRYFLSAVPLLAAVIGSLLPARRVAMAALVLLAVLAGYDLAVRPIFASSPAPAFTRLLIEQQAGRDDVVTFQVADRYLSQIRLLTKGAVWPRMAAGSQPNGTLAPEDARDPGSRLILVRDDFRSRLADRYDFAPAGFSYRRPRPADVWRMLREGRERVEPELRVGWSLGIRRPELAGLSR